jgi:serine/threonine-protein kinase
LDTALQGLLAERLAIERGDFLAELPLLAPDPPPEDVVPRFSAGAAVGPWRLLRPLGQGGMSVVWLAERADRQIERQVALKLPHAGPGQELLARRLLRERAILAALEHPQIARLYDVGLTGDGTPYLVMEHIQEGQDLLAHADAKRLNTRQRVALFQQVLRAVQYAHGQLVLHRDLKPGNILVTPQGEVKLLDFGIAKLLADVNGLGDASELTRAAGRQLTPFYASPEQLAGGSLGTASDVYSLGVVLHELLCGRRPHQAEGSSPAQQESSVLNDDPRPPSWQAARALAKALRGDLDAIVLKALARQPAERYATAEAFNVDLERWRSGLPVQARAPGVLYYLGKFVHRHRWTVGLGGTAAVLMLAAATLALLEGRAARSEAARAATARDFLLELFAEAAPDRLGGLQLDATQLMEQGREKARSRLVRQPRLQAELLAGIGETQRQMHDLAGAEAALAQAAVLYRTLGDPAQEAAVRLSRFGVAALDARADGVGRLYQELLPLAPVMERDALLRLRWLHVRGWHALFGDDIEAAQGWLMQCAEQADPGEPRQVEVAFDARMALATALARHGREAEAEAQVAAAARLPPGDKPAAEAERSVALAFMRSDVELYADRYAAVLGWLPDSISGCERSFGSDSQRCGELKQRRLWALLRLGQAEQALALAAELGPMLNRARARYAQFSTAYLLVRVLAVNGRNDRGLAPVAVLEGLLHPDQTDPLPLAYQLPAINSLALLQLRGGDRERAEAWLQRADTLSAGLAPGQYTAELKGLRVARGLALQARGFDAQALQALGPLCEVATPKPLIASLSSLNCVRSLVALGRQAQAVELVRQALPVLQRSLGEQAPNTQRARRLMDSLQAPGGFRRVPWDAAQLFVS